MARRTLVIVGLFALVLTGCRAESVTRVRIHPDGNATVIAEGAFDEEALELIGEADDRPEDVLTAIAEIIDPSLLPVPVQDAQTEQFRRGDLQGLRVTLSGLNAAEASRQISSDNSIIDEVVLRVDEGVLTISGRTRSLSDFERSGLQSLAPGDLTEILTLLLQVEVPGRVLEHSADRVLADGLLEWDLLPAITEGRTVAVSVVAEVDPSFQFDDLAGTPLEEAEDEPVEESGTPWLVVVVSLLAAGLVSALIIRRLQRRRLREIEGFTPRT